MKRFLLPAVLVLCAAAVSLHAEEKISMPLPVINTQFVGPASFKDFLHQIDVFTSFAPMFILNTEAGTKSAPSPVVYPVTIGASWPNYYFVSFQPRLSFYYNYYLWNDDEQIALPAEVENRTATALSFLLTLPAVFSFHFTENTTLEAEAGISLLLRAGILSNDVSASDSGTSGSAESDTERINEWFWSNARFLYAETGASWLYDVTGTIKAGPELHFYLPLGSLFSGRGMDAMMLSTGIKLIF
ncbi:MAG TPA: hypothetical protein DCL73_14865 [Treponema sp.]|nr:hypothetical protein [Treponema sp.]